MLLEINYKNLFLISLSDIPQNFVPQAYAIILDKS